MALFSVDVLTPNKVLARDLPAESLLVPTTRGEINILPEHTHIITKLGKGALTIFSPSSEEDRAFFVSEGICKVVKNKVLILAAIGEEVNHIEIGRAQKSLEHSMDLLKNKSLTPSEFEELTQKIERAKLRLYLAQTYKGKISE